ncbi:N-acetylmuramoyl-L-alanine amidase family protein [Sporomusa acidovorans]|uniref:N-acetylmuramoyl-L-alanine amidase LytC n=1 Tax=Sporomusa acidovorans (strain ATCC 49682 / DSM 3132 / Mol) TaxID=1123286 RepID=A0ABZ3J9S4_SPOA4|nr:N-acetylmuramoyl-L-alanine amidase [Sporomusa acidovorans]OZC15996.1 N-acetylmuramoyl-L-alanine amidase LytC precursor [Sporomusa acidovorans DSM 3132]SDD90326.1 N-acetylmuramoyl-L-alanine amidase [Sporomusa acidovorans]
MYKVCIDPGHAGGNTDPGACNPVTGLQEADVALAVSKLVAHYLDAAGCEVRLTRTEQEQPETDDLSYRTGIANDWQADLFISVHCNSVNYEYAQGTETWYCDGSVNGKKLAAYIQNQIIKSIKYPDGRNIANRGVRDAVPGVNGLYVLSHTDCPAVLVEMAFISNTEDEKLLADRQDDFARAIARGVTDYLQGV